MIRTFSVVPTPMMNIVPVSCFTDIPRLSKELSLHANGQRTDGRLVSIMPPPLIMGGG